MTIKEVFKNYKDEDENGVYAYGNKLSIRPKYQREFVYDEKQRNSVIDTVFKKFPLNVMYWIKNNDNSYEVLDGQQRTISIGQYLNGDFSVNYKYFHNLTTDIKEKFYNYKLMIYICEGNESEKLDWFKTINIAGEKLTNQELRNAIYTGEWLSDAKKYFSKNSCAAYEIGKEYLNGIPIRQDYLESILYWIADKDEMTIEQYMSEHQNSKNANELWTYFQSIINWIKLIFNKQRKEMKGLNWGLLFNKYYDSSKSFTPSETEQKIQNLMEDDEVSNKKGIYEYILTKNEKFLNLRAFNEKDKRILYENQHGICKICNKHFSIEEMEADHIIAWRKGGKTTLNNGQMLCSLCNRQKSDN